MDVAYASRPLAMPPVLVRGGAAIWVLLLVVLPAPAAARLFLAGPLLVVPLLLTALPDRLLIGRVGTRELAAWSLIGAGLVGGALSLAAGPSAAALAAAWIGAVGLIGFAALRHALPALPGLFRPARARDLATDGALGMLAVGALFLLIDRLGVAVLGFRAPYTLLGAIHYTFAGFGLLGIVALLAQPPALRHWLAAVGVIVGMSTTAAGLVSGVQAINLAGVLVLAAGGAATAWSLVAGARRTGRVRQVVLQSAALALFIGLSMGVLSASASTFGFAFVGVEMMVRTHGVLNALAVVVATLALAGVRGSREPR